MWYLRYLYRKGGSSEKLQEKHDVTLTDSFAEFVQIANTRQANKENPAHVFNLNPADIARYLGVLTIAEGVENEDQYLCLKKLGCDIVQGYYFSKAVEPKDFERFLEDKLQIMSDEKALETA